MKKLSTFLDFSQQSGGAVTLEVAKRNEVLLSGLWTFSIQYGGKTVKPVGEWTKICEHSERGCDYIEIELHLSGDYRLQRSVLINYKDEVLLLCDTVLNEKFADRTLKQTKKHSSTKALSFQTELSVSPELSAKHSAEATEIDFCYQGRSPAFRVFPLALSEWKSAQWLLPQSSEWIKPELLKKARVSGTLTTKEGALKEVTLILEHETSGHSLFAPLFFDFNAERLGKRYTWRHLSVGENMQNVQEYRAVGYRIQLGQEQFLLYRSLTSPTNRTVLGHNLMDDFCFARFEPETGVEPLIAVEVTE